MIMRCSSMARGAATTTRPLLLTAILAASGCGGKGVIPVEAKFTLDGQPLADANVSFVRTDGQQGRAAFGTTDKTGLAKLTTYEPLDGVLPGKYSVVVVKPPEEAHTYVEEEIGPEDIQKMVQYSAAPNARKARRQRRVRTVINKVYAAAHTTPLKCEVASDSSLIEFELTSTN